jgi:hypothetical protein
MARLGDRGDDACVFLDQSDLCSLHAELGSPGKPLGCQLYPYQPVQTPAGIFAHLSFGCPPVVAGLDQDIEANRRELAAALVNRSGNAKDSVEAPFLIRLTSERAVGWSSYLNLEARILSAYSADQPLESILKIVLAILRAAQDPTAPGDWPNLATLEDVDFAMEVMLKYLGSLVCAVENIDTAPDREAFLSALQSGNPTLSRRFAMELPGLAFHPLDDWARDGFRRYFHNAVLGKSLLKSTVVSRLLGCCCALYLAGFYAQAYLQARGAKASHLECWVDAFHLVEVEIVTHSRAGDLFFLVMEQTFRQIASFPMET